MEMQNLKHLSLPTLHLSQADADRIYVRLCTDARIATNYLRENNPQVFQLEK